MNPDTATGYLDGLNPNCPEPAANHSESYREGFAMGRRRMENPETQKEPGPATRPAPIYRA